MTENPLAHAHGLFTQAIDALAEAAGPVATDDDLLATLTFCEGATRSLDRRFCAALTDLQRRGAFTARGYTHAGTALADLLGWDPAEARRRVVAAEQIMPRVGLDGTVLPPKLAATAAVFTTGGCSLRHVDAIARGRCATRPAGSRSHGAAGLGLPHTFGEQGRLRVTRRHRRPSRDDGHQPQQARRRPAGPRARAVPRPRTPRGRARGRGAVPAGPEVRLSGGQWVDQCSGFSQPSSCGGE